MAKPKVTKEWKEKAIAKGKGDGAPVVTQENYKTSLMIALGYYNTNMDNSDRAKAIRTYIKHNAKQYASVFNDIPDYDLLSIGSLATIRNKGEYLSESDIAKFDAKVEELYERYKGGQEVEEKPKAPVISIEKRIIEAARTASEEIDYAIDRFIHTKTWDFSTKTHLIANNVSGAVAKKIGDYFKLNVDEIDEALEGKDEQLVEGYSFLTRTELKRFRAAVQSIVDDCAQHQVTAKKPRAVRVKPPAIIVKKLKYLVAHDLLKLKSINPAEIVGAKELWVYNIKTRKLINYTADDSDSLSVKGTTILNYSVARSSSKTLRDPEKFFKELSISKRNLNTAAKAIKTKPNQPNGRISSDMILLGAF